MKITKANKAQWKALFDTAAKFDALAPWQWLHDDQIFGVQDPKTGKIGWCCIMGAAEQVYGIMVYEDVAGYQSYLRLFDAGMNDYPLTDQIETAVNQLGQKVEFVQDDELAEEDIAAIKALGRKVTDEVENIQIRAFVPGDFPWFLKDEQIPFLITCLEQAMEGAKLLKKNPALLDGPKNEERLVRTAKSGKDGKFEWSNSYMPLPELEEVEEALNPFRLGRVKKLARTQKSLALSHTYMNDPIFEEEKHSSPYFPKMSIWADEETGMIISHELYQREENKDLIGNIIKDLEKIGFLPAVVSVNSEILHKTLTPLFDALEIQFEFYEEIELLDDIMAGMNGDVDDDMLDQMEQMMHQNPEVIAELMRQMNIPEGEMGNFMEMMRQMRDN